MSRRAPLRGRPDMPTLNLLLDILRSGRSSRNWFLTVALVLVLGAALLALVGQTVVPWLIYPAL